MNMRKTVGWTMVAFMMWFIIAKPDGAAGTLQSMGSMRNSAAQGMSTFITSVF